MNVLLVFPKILHYARTDFHPMGLLALAGYLKKHLQDIKINNFLMYNLLL